MRIKLTANEIETLFQQDPSTREDGGFQNYIISLQKKTDRNTGIINLTEKDLERIKRYAFEYGNGGWEKRLVSIFGRSLGQNLYY